MARGSAVSLVFVGFCWFSVGFLLVPVGFSRFSESVFLSVVSLDSVLAVKLSEVALKSPWKLYVCVSVCFC